MILLEVLAGYKNINSATYLLKITIFIPHLFDVLAAVETSITRMNHEYT